MSNLNTALKIFKKLLERGQLDRESDSDLFLEYRNAEVRSALAEMEEELQFRIVEAPSTLYLVPDSGNSLLGFVSKDLREWVASDARLLDTYLLSYIVMLILYLFYGGKNRNPKQREYLRISKLAEAITGLPGLWLTKQKPPGCEQYGLNFIRMAQTGRPNRTLERARKTKTGPSSMSATLNVRTSCG